MEIIYFILLGIFVGFLGSIEMNGKGLSVLSYVLIGIAGAILGGYLFVVLGIPAGVGLIKSLIAAVIGAIVLLTLIGPIKEVS